MSFLTFLSLKRLTSMARSKSNPSRRETDDRLYTEKAPKEPPHSPSGAVVSVQLASHGR